MDNSRFWLNNDINGALNLLELANTQKAITNFVKILTNKEIPVEFYSNNDGDSMTNGKKITISSSISSNTVDSVVGTALHEAAHCKYTNFNELKYLNNTLAAKNLMSGKEIISILLNFIEDRRIDNIVYNEAPGYQGYYRSMYERYFYSKTVDKALKGPEYRDENWNSYLFRIINIFNKNTDLNALRCLPTIFKAIDLKNIDRLKDTMDSLELAITLYGLLSAHFMLMTPEERKSQVQKNKQNASDKAPSREETKKAFAKQEQFINGKIHKATSSKKELNQIEAISKSNIKEDKVSAVDKNGVKRTDRKVHVVDGITKSIVDSNLAKYLAKKKAESVCNRSNDKYIIGCDQVLECNGKLISKAQNLVEAKENLAYLTGKKHQLFTCLYVLRNAEEYLVEETISQLYFKKISEKTIETYINENRKTALSCVGSYRIEDNDKYNFLEVLEGSEEAIIGFPLKNFIKKLRSN